jgi:hypothetical protein
VILQTTFKLPFASSKVIESVLSKFALLSYPIQESKHPILNNKLLISTFYRRTTDILIVFWFSILGYWRTAEKTNILIVSKSLKFDILFVISYISHTFWMTLLFAI